jgi:hypothetical protein
LTRRGTFAKLKAHKKYQVIIRRNKEFMRKIIALALLGIGSGVAAMAGLPTPEIDPSSVGSAVALLAGTLLVIRGRRRK